MFRICFGAFALFYSTQIHGQDKYLNGRVKELHYLKANKTRMLEGVNMILRCKDGVISQQTSSTGQFSFQNVGNPNCSLDFGYDGYEIVDKDEISNVQYTTKPSDEPMHILLSRIGIVEKITKEYFEKVNQRLLTDYKKAVDSIKIAYQGKNEELKKEKARLTERLASFQSQARSFADIFATADFEILSSNFYNAFVQFKYGNIDSCNYYLSDEFLDDDKRKITLQKHISAGACIMKAQIDPRKSKEVQDKYYKSAIEIDPRYYTLEAYCNYLLQNQRFKEVVPYLEAKIKLGILGEKINRRDYIYTLFQLSKVYDRPQHSKYDSSQYYTSLILKDEEFITSSGDDLLQSILVIAHQDLGSHYSHLRLELKDNKYENDYIKEVLISIRLYKEFNLIEKESPNIPPIDIGEQYYNIALTYEEIFSNKDSATYYYLKSIAYSKDVLNHFPNSDHLSQLEERYAFYSSSDAILKKDKLIFLNKEMKYLNNQTLDIRFKRPLIESIGSIITDLKAMN